MRRILAIVAQDLRVFLADRSNLPGLLLTPVVMTVIIGLVSGGAFGGTSTTLRLDVIDNDHTVASQRFLQSVSAADPAITLCPLESGEADACNLGEDGLMTQARGLARVAEGTAIGLLEIPTGLATAIENRQPGRVVLHTVTDFGQGQSAEQAVASALEQINGAAAVTEAGLLAIEELAVDPIEDDAVSEIEDSLYQQALRIWRQQPVQTPLELSGAEEGGVVSTLQRGLGHSVPGMGTMFVMMTVFGGMAALIEERRQGTLQRLAVMPIPRPALIAGKLLARFSLGILQFLVIFAVGAVLGMNFGEDPLALVVVAAAYTLAVTAISFAIGSRLANPAQAAGLTLLLTLTLAPLGGAWWPLEISPQFMQMAGRVSPISWAMMAFTRLTYEGAHLDDLWMPILVLLAMTVVAFALAIPRFRYQLAEA
ncbi:MAG TPA: ABC transporter permease [Anaerolineales bacterium]|jgi:ABC-type Na+ efflux pump permease subunit